jgi:hypothetical protein
MEVKVLAPLLILMLVASTCLALSPPLTVSAQGPEPKARAVSALEQTIESLNVRLKEVAERLNDTQSLKELEGLKIGIQQVKALVDEGRYEDAWQLGREVLANLSLKLKALYERREELKAKLEERMANLSARVQAEMNRALIEVMMKVAGRANLTQLNSTLAQARAYVERGRHEEARGLLAQCMRKVEEAALNNTSRRAIKAAERELASLDVTARGIDNAISRIASTAERLDALAEHLEEVGASPNATAALKAAALHLESVALHLESVRELVATGAINVTLPSKLETKVEALIERSLEEAEGPLKEAPKMNVTIPMELKEQLQGLKPRIQDALRRGNLTEVRMLLRELEAAKVELLRQVVMVRERKLRPLIPEGREEKWIPYIPTSEQVSIDVYVYKVYSPAKPSKSMEWMVSVRVTLTFPSAGFQVSSWGALSREGNDLLVDARVMQWTGPSAQVVTKAVHVYTLGKLEPGTYTFTFKAWGQPVASTTFKVPAG